MDVILAKSAGFCPGVKRAVDMVYEEAKANASGRIYTYGPIIHNAQVVDDLKAKGVEVIDDIEAFDGEKGTVVIRSHGAARKVYEAAAEKGLEVVDATCPFVKKIHNIVMENSRTHRICIIGDRNHPEVQGIVGWCVEEPIVIGNEQEAEKMQTDVGKPLCIVAQTTFNTEKFQHLVEKIKEKEYDTVVINTICSATDMRQREAAEISAHVDVMIVIGDPKSSNTAKLVDICRSNCKDTYHIQTVRDLLRTDLQSGQCVGITAGASTPHYLIQEVLTYVRSKF